MIKLNPRQEKFWRSFVVYANAVEMQARPAGKVEKTDTIQFSEMTINDDILRAIQMLFRFESMG